MPSPSLFISYSHQNEKWKELLVKQLRVLELEGIWDLWEDRRIAAGDEWRSEIEEAIKKATVAILLISAEFLTSKFIRGEEVPKLLERRKKEGLRVIPIIVEPCAWKQVKWLAQIQARPKDGKPLSGGNRHQINTRLTEIVEEIAQILSSHGEVDKKGTRLTSKSESLEPLSSDKAEKTTRSPVQVLEESRSDLNQEEPEITPEQESIDDSLKDIKNDTKPSEGLESNERFEEWKKKVMEEAEQKDFIFSAGSYDDPNLSFKWSNISTLLRRLNADLAQFKKIVEEFTGLADPKYLNNDPNPLLDKYVKSPDLKQWAKALGVSGFMLNEFLPQLRISWGRLNGAWEQLIKGTGPDEVELLSIQRQLDPTNDMITEIIRDLGSSQKQLKIIHPIVPIDNAYVEDVVKRRLHDVKETLDEFINQLFRVEEMSNFLKES